ncbi:MAG: succinate dehydrogenase, hydrophobic membrane anchor protein [Pseudomonadota bacterium]
MAMRTPLSRVRGLGSAKDGTHHWWMQRLSAVALVPLTVWFVISMISFAGADHAAVSAWLAQPLSAVLMLLLVVATFYHLQLGVQVVIEDYIHGEAAKIACLVALKLLSIALGVAGVFAVLKVAF